MTYNCIDYTSDILNQKQPSNLLQLNNCSLDVSKECCKYVCIMSNSLMGNVSHCNRSMTPAYFDCRNSYTLGSRPSPPDLDVWAEFKYYQYLGTVLSATTVACCTAVFLISLYCKFYSQWAEQIILSKTLFVFGFGICLLTSFQGSECTLKTSVATLSLIFGDILWTCVLLWKLVYTVKRPFQQASHVTGIVGNWAFVVVSCWIFAAGAYAALENGLNNVSAGAGYLQYVPICLVSRMFAEKEDGVLALGFNFKLFFFLYVPYLVVFIMNSFGLVYIWRRFSLKNSKLNASLSARLRVLRTIKQYLASYFIYTFFLVVIYIIPINVHSCTSSTLKYSATDKYRDENIENKERIVQFPPSCVSWKGYLCNGETNPSVFYIGMQKTFFALFCLRGVPDLIVFFFLNKNRIIELIRGRECVAPFLR
jgi:hypothetical protein